MTSLGGCCYHCSYLISTYCENPKVTITEERDADIVEFPALTICNLNVIKKEYANSYFELASTKRRRKGNSSNPVPLNVNSTVCFYSEEELLRDSAIDLSDAWLNLGVTKDNLSKYGHKAQDLIVQCTYNSKECGNGSTFGISVTNVTSPTFGLCHTVNVRNKTKDRPASVRKGGTIYGIRLTLNIERDEYWDLISAEYGVRLMVHPQGTYPTLQRGGIIVDPGRSVHIGVRRRVSKLLPGREGSCTDTFADSRVIRLLRKQDLDFELSHLKYTYEHCNTLCQNSLLFEHCGCLDEQPKVGPTIVKWRFCNPCNKTEGKTINSYLFLISLPLLLVFRVVFLSC
nr:acid-sensing ion channel 1C-like [Parasteatoda tepidariorum]